MMVSLLAICVTRPQWLKPDSSCWPTGSDHNRKIDMLGNFKNTEAFDLDQVTLCCRITLVASVNVSILCMAPFYFPSWNEGRLICPEGRVSLNKRNQIQSFME